MCIITIHLEDTQLTNKQYTAKVITDENGDLCLEFTDEVMEALGIGIGDTIEWSQNDQGNWQFTKVETDEQRNF